MITRVIVLTALLALTTPAWASGPLYHAHQTAYNVELVGGGVVSEGMGFARRYGAPATGEFEVVDVPVDAVVIRASLYWQMIGGFDDTVIVNGQEFYGTHIGITDDTCWGYGNNNLYRADVFDQVQGNGTYFIEGLDYVQGGLDNQGFSIVVVYTRPTSDQLTRVVINDGGIYGGNSYAPVTSSMSFDPIGGTPTMVKVHYMVGDSQGAGDGATNFNGTAIAWDNFEGSDGPGGDGAMWDDDTFDVTASNLVQINDTGAYATIADPEGSDCLAWAAFVVQISYPNPCPDGDGDLYTTCDDDCDDTNPDIHPGAVETMNGIDDDCDGVIDNVPGTEDNDGDGWTPNDGDCNDNDATIYPGADDIPDDGIDQDCDGYDAGTGDDDDDDNGGDDDGGGGYTPDAGACNCTVAGATAWPLAPAALFGLVGLMFVRRRR